MQSGPIPQPWAILHNSDYIHVQMFCGIEFNQVSSRDATHQISTSRLRCLKCNIAWLVAQSTELRFQHQNCTAVSLAFNENHQRISSCDYRRASNAMKHLEKNEANIYQFVHRFLVSSRGPLYSKPHGRRPRRTLLEIKQFHLPHFASVANVYRHCWECSCDGLSSCPWMVNTTAI